MVSSWGKILRIICNHFANDLLLKKVNTPLKSLIKIYKHYYFITLLSHTFNWFAANPKVQVPQETCVIIIDRSSYPCHLRKGSSHKPNLVPIKEDKVKHILPWRFDFVEYLILSTHAIDHRKKVFLVTLIPATLRSVELSKKKIRAMLVLLIKFQFHLHEFQNSILFYSAIWPTKSTYSISVSSSWEQLDTIVDKKIKRREKIK